MTSMNPLRDDKLATQERVIQLERDLADLKDKLAEKNELIYNLQHPKPKKPRTPIDWSRLPVKTLKVIGFIGLGACLFYTCEPNALYTSGGVITYVGATQTKTNCYGPTNIVLEKGETKTKNTECHTYVSHDIKVCFLDINGKMRETFIEGFEKDEWLHSDYLPETVRKVGSGRVIYPKNTDYLKEGCIVGVYFLRSFFLRTRPWWADPKIDASTCIEPGTEESKKAEEPPRNADDDRRPNHRIE